ncbi:MAG TPA: ATP-binding protein [Anaeromyxobacteraceae bacterium]|nr:ATP-binding protein [Anaeromyxobacteraceae bacterium]
MSSWSGTAQRLLLGFGVLVAIFAVASWLTLRGLGQIHGAIERTRAEEEGVRIALELASAVRDQYAHQAHTIIIGNESHLGFYGQAERRVLDLTRALRAHASGPDETGWVDDVEAASAELDDIFRRAIVPAVVRGDVDFVRSEHARAQLVVTRIQDRAEALVAAFEARIGAARAEAGAVERRTFAFILAMVVGAPLLAAAVTWSIGRSIARPVARLREGAARLAAGDLEARVEARGPAEFEALAAQFNAMTASLKEHQVKLVQSEKLAGVGRLAAGVAHELNNPLAVILGYVRLLQKRCEGGFREDLAVIEEETLRCKEIVEDLLELSRPGQATQERVDLRALADDVVARLGEARLLEGVAVEVEGAGAAPGHASKLGQVLANLVRNGGEAAGPGGRVTVRVSEEDGEARVRVEDSGPGLDGAARDRLFEPFFTTKPRGTGLGLAVSRAIARAHGGDVEAGDADGGGASFTLRLPRTSPADEGRA